MQAAQAVEQFDAQQAKLQELAKAAGRRAKAVIGDAVAEIQGLYAEVARAVSSGLGLGMRACDETHHLRRAAVVVVSAPSGARVPVIKELMGHASIGWDLFPRLVQQQCAEQAGVELALQVQALASDLALSFSGGLGRIQSGHDLRSTAQHA